MLHADQLPICDKADVARLNGLEKSWCGESVAPCLTMLRPTLWGVRVVRSAGGIPYAGPDLSDRPVESASRTMAGSPIGAERSKPSSRARLILGEEVRSADFTLR